MRCWVVPSELSIFSKHYSTEIASVEVASGRIDRFGQGQGYSNRCILVYSGIHYDSCFLSLTPTIDDPAFCETVFSVDNEGILEATMRLAARLKQDHYYTDTATFDLRCGVCGQGLKGEKEATEHAKATSHTDFRCALPLFLIQFSQRTLADISVRRTSFAESTSLQPGSVYLRQIYRQASAQAGRSFST